MKLNSFILETGDQSKAVALQIEAISTPYPPFTKSPRVQERLVEEP